MNAREPATLTEAAREAAAEALRKSRLTWGTHSNRWGDAPWQRDFWGEAADVALAALQPHLAEMVAQARRDALTEAADAMHDGTAGPDDIGIARWPGPAQEAYLVAISEAEVWLRERADAMEAGEDA